MKALRGPHNRTIQRRASATLALAVGLWLTGCSGDPTSDDPPPDGAVSRTPDAPGADGADGSDLGPPPADGGDTGEAGPPPPVDGTWWVLVSVTLDGAPAPEGTLVLQGGRYDADAQVLTNAEGQAMLELDLTVEGDIAVLASHPEARIKATQLYPSFGLDDSVTVALERYDPTDNLDYVFQDPGEPGRRETTAQCGHCHLTMNDDWVVHVHRDAARNPRVRDLYAGAAAALGEALECESAGGQWREGRDPATAEAAMRCYVGAGVLPDLNPGCGSGATACDGEDGLSAFGGCADCHAPGIDGALGGRDMRDAQGHAYDYGVHCDVCHRTESVDPDADLAGVAGKLHLHRPSEPPKSLSLGQFSPLTFGPDHDVPNVRMGTVQRDHFHESTLCAGCHQLDQEVLVPGEAIDLERWPSGRLPIHSTYAEWADGPMNPGAPCQSCHMPPDPQVANFADAQVHEGATIGIVAGWLRPAGTARKHAWVGPRTPGGPMLRLAAGVKVTPQGVEAETGEAVAEVRVSNLGPGHAIPTGEPLRALVLLVEARCGGEVLPATGGHAVWDVGGARGSKEAGDDWTVWPGAEVGQVLRVVARPADTYVDYEGPGVFGDGTFDLEGRGLREEMVTGAATITAVGDAGEVTLDGPLPEGDRVYLGEPIAWPSGDPADAEVSPGGAVPTRALAGAPGFAFARVVTGPGGARHVPHFLAVDVVSDNRLMPTEAFTTTHRVDASPCAEGEAPTWRATLMHRMGPPELARERGWQARDRFMAEDRR